MAKKETKSFEEQLKYIETLTEQLESTDLSLSDSLALYEKGLLSVKAAQKTLLEAKEKIDFLETKHVHGSDN